MVGSFQQRINRRNQRLRHVVQKMAEADRRQYREDGLLPPSASIGRSGLCLHSGCAHISLPIASWESAATHPLTRRFDTAPESSTPHNKFPTDPGNGATESGRIAR